MEMDITTLSSKGQIVIPAEMRKGLEVGEKLLLIKNDSQIIIKRLKDMNEKLKEDIEFARRTEESWKQYERGEFITMDFDEFLEKAKKW